VIAVALLTSACAAAPAGPSATTVVGSPGQTSPASGDVSLRFEIPPVPGPVKPYRGDMIEQVFLRDGYVSMYFELRNVGEEPVTFLNTLYDYEPTQLYAPVVRLAWKEGGDAIYTRAGHFFPSPAIIQPGDRAVYIMGGQATRGTGTPGELVTHIKYCPTRGMDDLPGIPVEVSNLSWRTGAGGQLQVSGTLTDVAGASRLHSPSIGVAFFDASGTFIGAVVDPGTMAPLNPGEQRQFTISGAGVAVDRIARAEGYAVIS